MEKLLEACPTDYDYSVGDTGLPRPIAGTVMAAVGFWNKFDLCWWLRAAVW